jgi:alanine dehydrogenase
MKIGLIREGKTPPDRRVALVPAQCVQVKTMYPEVEMLVQPSPHRCLPDSAYAEAGCVVTEDLTGCDLLFGIKEVPIAALIPGKTYFFFSHTIKAQKYNRRLLQTVLERDITLVDYECLTDEQGGRIIAFGRYAGIVGAYNAFWTYGKKYGRFELKRAYQCRDRFEMEAEYAKIKLRPIKIAVTGSGRVGQGALEVLTGMGIPEVSPGDFLQRTVSRTGLYPPPLPRLPRAPRRPPVGPGRLLPQPGNYRSAFKPYAEAADMLIASAYWNPQAPPLFTRDEMGQAGFRIRVVADITCDIDGSIPSTVRPSTILDPVYDYSRTATRWSRRFRTRTTFR